jgi:hypothetical protein
VPCSLGIRAAALSLLLLLFTAHVPTAWAAPGAGGAAGAGAVTGQAGEAPCTTLDDPKDLSADFGSVVVIDPETNAGTGLLMLENHTGQKVSGLSLRADKFVNTLTERTVDSEVAWSSASDEKAALIYPFDLEPNERRAIKMTVTRVWDAGNFAASVFLGKYPLGRLRAERLRVPFGITLANAGTEAKPLHAGQALPLILTLKNGDALTYGLNWELVLEGDNVGEKQGRAGCDSQPVIISASSDLPLKLCLPARSFPSYPGALFKDRVVHGELRVSHAADRNGPVAPAMKVFPVVLGLGSSSEDLRTACCFVLTGIVLILGGLCSLFLRHAIPNSVQRLALRSRLDELAGDTKSLSDCVPPRLRVDLRIARLGLGQRIDNEQMIFPGAAEVMTQIERQTETLSKRVELITRFDRLLRDTEALGSDGPPDLLEQQRAALLNGMRLLETEAPSATALAEADSTISTVDTMLKRIASRDDALRNTVINEATAFWAEAFARKWDGAPDVPWAKTMRENASGFVAQARDRFEQVDGKPPPADSLTTLDATFKKLKVLADYMRVCSEASAEDALRFDEVGWEDRNEPKNTTQRERFFDCLSRAGSRNMAQVELLLRQAEQGIFMKQLVAELEHGNFALVAMPQYAIPFDPISFRVQFFRTPFNEAAARQKLDCEWTFPHGVDERTESGWEPSQFFSVSGRVSVRVAVRHGSEAIILPGTRSTTRVTIHARKNKLGMERTKLELIQLGVALAVTLAALASGARDQLEKLDLLGAIAAIFVLGFGADVVKNLVARRTPPASPASAS